MNDNYLLRFRHQKFPTFSDNRKTGDLAEFVTGHAVISAARSTEVAERKEKERSV